ncbi:MAG: hypothetical protein AB7O24_19100 [Kofleriaceae bacterium]
MGSSLAAIIPPLVGGTLCCIGCGRIGFDPIGADGKEGSDGANDSTSEVTSANDTCATAADIDLSTGFARFTFTTQGAASDYPQATCCNAPGFTDVVVRVRNPMTSTVGVSCASHDGSDFAFALMNTGACPTPADTPSCSDSTCSMSTQAKGGIIDGHLFLFCRDTSLGPLTIELRNQ